MRFVRKSGITPAVLIGFITTVTAFAQTQLQVEAPAPNPVNNASATITGNNGNGTYYYWVIANYPTGATFPTGPAVAQLAPSPLTASNYVKVSWAPVTGATTVRCSPRIGSEFPRAVFGV